LFVRYRFNASEYSKLSKRRRIVFWCWWAAFLAFMCFYVCYIFPKTLRTSLNSKPKLDFTTSMVIFSAGLIVIGVLFVLLDYLARRADRRDLDERVRGVDGKTLTPEYFLDNRAALKADDFTGVYVLHNMTKDLYYVGQGVRVYERLSQHFMGHGNADVYADWKYGDRFEIKVVPLAGSGYQSLNDLERDAIASYDAYEKGYNRTRGNAR
jgi:hypothetical protein